MRTDTVPMPTLLSDYTPPSHELTSVYLDFDLQPSATTVKSKIEVKRLRDEPLVLNGENISLKSVTLDGTKLKRSQYKLDQETLTLQKTSESFTVEIETLCDPSSNSTLMGLAGGFVRRARPRVSAASPITPTASAASTSGSRRDQLTQRQVHRSNLMSFVVGQDQIQSCDNVKARVVTLVVQCSHRYDWRFAKSRNQQSLPPLPVLVET